MMVSPVKTLLVAVAAVVACCATGLAAPASIDRSDGVSLNDRLAALAVEPPPAHAPSGPQIAQPQVAPRSSRNPLLTPAVLSLVAHYAKAERLLHFRRDGFDVNLWGAFQDGRGMHVRYTIKF